MPRIQSSLHSNRHSILRRGSLLTLANIRSAAALLLIMQDAGGNLQAACSIVRGVKLGQLLVRYPLDLVGLRPVVELDDHLPELVPLPLGDQLGPEPVVDAAGDETFGQKD